MKAKEFIKEHSGPWSDAPSGDLGGDQSIDIKAFTEVRRKYFQSFVQNLESGLLDWTDLMGDVQHTRVWYAPNTEDIIAVEMTPSSGSTTPARMIHKDHI